MSGFDIKVEKDIPVPRARTREKYPWEGMEPGDSFLVPLKEGRIGTAVRTSASHAGRVRGWKMIARVQGGGIRVWRIS